MHRRRRQLVVTQIFACGGMAAAEACDKQGDEGQVTMGTNLAAEGQGASPTAAVLPTAETPPASPIAAVGVAEQARCTTAQMQNGTAKTARRRRAVRTRRRPMPSAC